MPDKQVGTRANAQVRDLRIRVIGPADWRKLRRFHQRLSQQTIENRFHAAKRELSEPLAHRFTEMDGTDTVAFVATRGARGRIVGVARYSRLTSTSAEVAFVVEDEFQGHHLGSQLMKRLKEEALRNGITEFIGEVLPGNLPMLKLMAQAGKTRTSYTSGECRVVVDLTSEATERREQVNGCIRSHGLKCFQEISQTTKPPQAPKSISQFWPCGE